MMGAIRDAIAWSNSAPRLSMFVVTSGAAAAPKLEMTSGSYLPSRVRVYNLEDAGCFLKGRRVTEYDAQFNRVPDELEAYVTSCLQEAMSRGAHVAWFGFEGSFDFEAMLSRDMAPQVYAVADAGGVSVASDGELTSHHWAEQIAAARAHLDEMFD